MPDLFLLILLALIIITLINSIVIVNGSQVAVLERRWFGKPLPEGRVVAMRDEVGIQLQIGRVINSAF